MKIKIENKYILISTLFLSIIILIFFLLSYLVLELVPPTITLRVLVLFVFSLFLSFLITYGFTLISQTISDSMITLRRMLHFDSLSNPLLLKMSVEAPGTYHHSLIVSSLAQRACKSIGANSLLVKTAAYYHDIGKLTNPKIFIENKTTQNVFDENNAQEIRKNAQLIISHVKNGISLAKEYNIPSDIMDIIAQHHGTSRVLYFYALAKDKGLKVKKTDFRYPGPIPQSKEAAILMLADCVEAITRAHNTLNQKTIISMIDEVIEDKISDNQLDDAGISVQDTAKIRNSFINTLLGIYHQRIQYPKKNLKRFKK